MARYLMLVAVLVTAPVVWAAPITVPDDYPTIQAAVDATPESGTIQVRPGTYAEAVTVTRRQSITIVGLGGRPTIVAPAGKDAIRIVGPLPKPQYPSTMSVTGVDIMGGRRGVWTRKIRTLKLEDVTVTGAQRGIEISSVYAFIQDVTIDGASKGAGFRVTAYNDVSLLRCIARGGNGPGFVAKSKAGHASIFVGESVAENNAAEGFLVYAQQVASHEVRDNRAAGNGRSGFRIVHGSPQLLNNASDDNGGYGYWVDGHSGATQQDVIDFGNTASNNALGDYRIE